MHRNADDVGPNDQAESSEPAVVAEQPVESIDHYYKFCFRFELSPARSETVCAFVSNSYDRGLPRDCVKSVVDEICEELGDEVGNTTGVRWMIKSGM